MPPQSLLDELERQHQLLLSCSPSTIRANQSIMEYAPVDMSTKYVIVMVGLPARGKSYISRRIMRYLTWLGITTRIFNVGSYRRSEYGDFQPHNFFDPDNPEGEKARWENSARAMNDLLKWLTDGHSNQVAIFDATNTTRERRNYIQQCCIQAGIEKYHIIFVESVCNDSQVIDLNVRNTKLKMPDYANMAPDQAIEDFLLRIRHYEKAYQPLSSDDQDSELSYVRLIDIGKQIVMNRIHGYLPAKIVFLLMNLHVTPRIIWISRHGESEFNALGRIGGDSDLTENGLLYARLLTAFIKENLPKDSPLVIWTSTLQRSIHTVEEHLLPYPVVRWKALDEIDSGICDGMTYEEIHQQMPQEFENRNKDKFRYRYPRGESYMDLIHRLEPVITELERTRSPVLIVCHQAVTRALYAYLKGMAPSECPNLPIPLHTVIELTPNAYGVDETRYVLGETIPLTGGNV